MNSKYYKNVLQILIELPPTEPNTLCPFPNYMNIVILIWNILIIRLIRLSHVNGYEAMNWIIIIYVRIRPNPTHSRIRSKLNCIITSLFEWSQFSLVKFIFKRLIQTTSEYTNRFIEFKEHIIIFERCDCDIVFDSIHHVN